MENKKMDRAFEKCQRFISHGPTCQKSKEIHHATLEPRNTEVPGRHDRATTRSLIGVAILTERGTIWSATQVGLRPVESGLGGYEEGVFSVDGVNPTSHSSWEWVGRPSECGTFSGYARAENEGDIDELNSCKETA